jgi:hypothetical protein
MIKDGTRTSFQEGSSVIARRRRQDEVGLGLSAQGVDVSSIAEDPPALGSEIPGA